MNRKCFRKNTEEEFKGYFECKKADSWAICHYKFGSVILSDDYYHHHMFNEDLSECYCLFVKNKDQSLDDFKNYMKTLDENCVFKSDEQSDPWEHCKDLLHESYGNIYNRISNRRCKEFGLIV